MKKWLPLGLAVLLAVLYAVTAGAVHDIAYVVISGDTRLPAYRTLVGSSPIVVTDAGAQGNLTISCPTCGAGGGGITTLNTLTAATQTFADVDDTNVTLTIGSAGSTHTFTLGWTGTLADARIAALSASKLTGTTLPASIVASSLTSVGTIGAGVWQGTAVADGYIASALTSKTYSSASQAAFTLNPYGVGAGNTGEIRFVELAAGGTNYVGFKAPDSITANVIWTLPNADGSSGDVLTTNGAGGLSWTAGGGGGGGAPTSASYVTMANDATLTAERVLTAGSNITVTDGGANSTVTVALSATYPGQTSISTLGTITSGTWQGTAIADAYLPDLNTLSTGLTASRCVQADGSALLSSAAGLCVTSVSGTSPIVSSGGTTPAISLATSGVTPGSYTRANVTVDSYGRLTAAASGSAVTEVLATSPIVSSNPAGPSTTISCPTCGSGGWVDDGAIVRLATSTDSVRAGSNPSGLSISFPSDWSTTKQHITVGSTATSSSDWQVPFLALRKVTGGTFHVNFESRSEITGGSGHGFFHSAKVSGGAGGAGFEVENVCAGCNSDGTDGFIAAIMADGVGMGTNTADHGTAYMVASNQSGIRWRRGLWTKSGSVANDDILIQSSSTIAFHDTGSHTTGLNLAGSYGSTPINITSWAGSGNRTVCVNSSGAFYAGSSSQTACTTTIYLANSQGVQWPGTGGNPAWITFNPSYGITFYQAGAARAYINNSGQFCRIGGSCTSL